MSEKKATSAKNCPTYSQAMYLHELFTNLSVNEYSREYREPILRLLIQLKKAIDVFNVERSIIVRMNGGKEKNVQGATFVGEPEFPKRDPSDDDEKYGVQVSKYRNTINRMNEEITSMKTSKSKIEIQRIFSSEDFDALVKKIGSVELSGCYDILVKSE